VKRDRPLPKQSDGQAPLEKRYVLVWLCAFAGCFFLLVSLAARCLLLRYCPLTQLASKCVCKDA
jgi:hypothetical protein